MANVQVQTDGSSHHQMVLVWFGFFNDLPSPDIYCRLFPRWICEINPTDLKNVPSGASG